MTLSTAQKLWTNEEFMALPDDGGHYELVEGELVDMGNSGMEHGNIGAYLGGLLELYVRSHKLGVTCDSSTAFAMKTGNKRSPDVSFVAKKRLKGLKRLPKGFFEGAPDLAVEILSPDNTIEEIHSKIVEYFANEAQLVWVIHPDEQYVLVYHEPQPDRLLRISDVLSGEEVVPGFEVAIADLFVTLDFDTNDVDPHDPHDPSDKEL
ncbi:MAG: Uma2 family endonuclease [Leptolyngbyaceae bacterium]|nr:Uma2 family endonuclease [Leptolyngbyaceae bacterium]